MVGKPDIEIPNNVFQVDSLMRAVLLKLNRVLPYKPGQIDWHSAKTGARPCLLPFSKSDPLWNSNGLGYKARPDPGFPGFPISGVAY